MKKLCFLLCFIPFITLGSENKDDNLPVIMFKQGITYASTCHVKYTISEIIFNLKENGDTEGRLAIARDKLGNKLVDDILNFNGAKLDYLNSAYNKCIKDGITENERKYK